MSSPNAARLGDDIIYTSILADILEGAFEVTIYVAVEVIVVAATAPLAATAATIAGVSATTAVAVSVVATTHTAVGIVGGLTVSLSGVVEVVGDIVQGAANFTSPPSLQGKIVTDPLNAQTNSLSTVRAVGRLMTVIENTMREKMEVEEKMRREEEDTRMPTGIRVLNGASALFSYGGELLDELTNPIMARPSGGAVEA